MHPLVIIGPVAAAIYWKSRKKTPKKKKRGHLWARHGLRVAGRGQPQQHVVVPAPEIEVSPTVPSGESTGEAEVIHPEVPIPDPAPVEVPVVETVEVPAVEETAEA